MHAVLTSCVRGCPSFQGPEALEASSLTTLTQDPPQPGKAGELVIATVSALGAYPSVEDVHGATVPLTVGPTHRRRTR